MKIRTGFVSNSSSSSFVVALDRAPETVDELKHLLFGENDGYEGHSAWEVAATVFKDIKDAGEATVEQVIDEAASGTPYGRDVSDRLEPDYPSWFKDMTPQQFNEKLAAWQKTRREWAAGTVQRFLDRTKGKKYFIVTYGDEDGQYYSDLEHGGLFDALPYVQVSHH